MTDVLEKAGDVEPFSDEQLDNALDEAKAGRWPSYPAGPPYIQHVERLKEMTIKAHDGWAIALRVAKKQEAVLAACQAEAGVLFAGVEDAYKECLPAGGEGPDTPEKWMSRRDLIRFRLHRLMTESTPASQVHAERMKLFEEFWSLARPVLNAVNPETPVGTVIAKIDALDGGAVPTGGGQEK